MGGFSDDASSLFSETLKGLFGTDHIMIPPTTRSALLVSLIQSSCSAVLKCRCDEDCSSSIVVAMLTMDGWMSSSGLLQLVF